jgi:hypothetical protein
MIGFMVCGTTTKPSSGQQEQCSQKGCDVEEADNHWMQDGTECVASAARDEKKGPPEVHRLRRASHVGGVQGSFGPGKIRSHGYSSDDSDGVQAVGESKRMVTGPSLTDSTCMCS